jgi:hypothetical protein
MADNETLQFKTGKNPDSQISLSQALLAPLDAIFKAQLHSARSFLNMLLQLGYKHQHSEDGKSGQADKNDHYTQEFYFESQVDGQTKHHKVSIPALALVPIAPLAVESAEFNLRMEIEGIEKHSQFQEKKVEEIKSRKPETEDVKSPWYLVQNPISIRGKFGSPCDDDTNKKVTSSSAINIQIKVNRIPIPAGLDKLLVSLTQSTVISTVSDDQNVTKE